MRDELNYEQEAANLDLVGKNLREFPRLHMPPPGPNFDPVAHNTEVSRLVARHHNADLEELNVGRSILMLDNQARSHGLRPPPELAILGKTLA